MTDGGELAKLYRACRCPLSQRPLPVPGIPEGYKSVLHQKAEFALCRRLIYKPPMRLRSDIYVSALIRRVFSAGGFAAVERKGMDQAGAIFVRRRSRDGLEALYGPAPQSLVDDAAATDRLFEIRLDRVEAAEVDALIARELKWDSDLWVLEIEMDQLGDLLPLTEA